MRGVRYVQVRPEPTLLYASVHTSICLTREVPCMLRADVVARAHRSRI